MKLAAELYSEKLEALQKPPESRVAVWLYMATGNDPVQLDLLARKDQVTWGANPNTRAGDIVLMYRTAPYSDIAYLFRAKSDVRPTPQTNTWKWDFGVELGDKVDLHNPVSLKSLRDQPALQEWGLLHANMQGAMRRQKGIQEEGQWESFRGLLVAWNPDAVSPLAEWENLTTEELLAEALKAIGEIPDEAERSERIADVAHYLPASLVRTAWSVAVTIGAARLQAEALIALIPHLSFQETRELLPEALAILSQGIELAPGDASLVASRGDTYWRLQRYPEALADFDRSHRDRAQ